MAEAHDSNDQLTAALNALLARNNGDSAAVAQLLFSENYQLREARRQLQERMDALSAQMPDANRVLSEEDVAAWQAYRAIGKPDDWKALQATLATVQEELQTVTRQRQATEAAAALRWNATVLSDRMPAGSKLETRLVADGKGNQIPTPFIIIENKETKLADYGAEHWKVYLPALQQDAAGTATGTPWPAQQGRQPSPGTEDDTGASVKNTLARRYSKPGAEKGT